MPPPPSASLHRTPPGQPRSHPSRASSPSNSDLLDQASATERRRARRAAKHPAPLPPQPASFTCGVIRTLGVSSTRPTPICAAFTAHRAGPAPGKGPGNGTSCGAAASSEPDDGTSSPSAPIRRGCQLLFVEVLIVTPPPPFGSPPADPPDAEIASLQQFPCTCQPRLSCLRVRSGSRTPHPSHENKNRITGSR